MLFNSYEFIFAFLPLTAVCFYILGSFSSTLALHWLIAASLFFYAWWRPLNVLIIAPSILVNFILARSLQRLGKNGERSRAANAILFAGIAFNVVFLGYFKYKNFFEGAINDVFGTNLILTHVILPLGISFITFQKIAFLIDVHAGRIESFTLRDYCLFVLFFPQLIAGPIVHYREIMPQFRKTTCRFDMVHVSTGLTLFFFGLFKKAVLADGIAPIVTSIYEHAGQGGRISLFPAWMAALGFTLQIYFDFSGYSDMAIGAARLFGVRLPANFNSPLRASSIIDFWLRWHMTLTRFLTAYIYNPLVLSLTRRRLAKGRPGLSSRNRTIGAFISLLMLPTILTMLISGLWHGAGYLFVFWGALHGIYLTINHAWRLFRPKMAGNLVPARLSRFAGFALTFCSVTVAMVFFRSPTMASAVNVVKGMSGLNGITLPAAFHSQLARLGGLMQSTGIMAETWLTATDFVTISIWIVILMCVALVCPNTLQILDQYEPALGVKPHSFGQTPIGRLVGWNTSIAWMIVAAAVVMIAILHIAGPSEFLYWQF